MRTALKKILAALSLGLAISLTITVVQFSFATPEDAIVTPLEYRRGAEQTYLTYPEWFLVFSPAELAAYLKSRPPSKFPFIGHIRQFWQGYRAVYEATKDHYPFNAGYHLMVMVIGISTTVEYALKYSYETLIGRLTELTRTHGLSEEDVFAANAEQDYVDFIRVQPWYEYDFAGKLGKLWCDTSLFGPDQLRKWERKYALTTEYGAKAIYGAIIKKLTKMSYGAPLTVTAVLLDRMPPDAAIQQLPKMKVLNVLNDGSVLVTVPRYDAFMTYAATLAAHGIVFREIAGNRGLILVSFLAPADSHQTRTAQVFLTQPILSHPGLKRIVLAVPIAKLSKTLLAASRPPYQLEHVYDF